MNEHASPLIAVESYRPVPIAGTTTRLPSLSAASLAGKPIAPRAWNVENWIPTRTVTMLSADGGEGKSTIAAQLLVATTTGTRWLGLDVRRGPAVYLSAEDDVDELHRRLQAILSFTDLRMADLSDLTLASLAGQDAVLATPDGRSGAMRPTPLFAELQALVKRVRPALIVLDNLADVFGGNEIDKLHARSFVGLLSALAIQADAAVLLVAHPSQSGMASGKGTSGNVAWSNSVRSRIYMTPSDNEPNVRDLEVKKSNYGPSGAKITVRYEAGRFVPANTSPARMGPELEEEARIAFLELLAQFTREGRNVSHQLGPTWAPKLFAAHPRGAGISRPVFSRAMDRLLSDHRIRIETFGPPSKQRTRLVLEAAA